MSRRFRAWSKSSMLRALSAVNLDRARMEQAQRRKWRPRVLLAFALGLAVGTLLTFMVG